MQFPTMAVAGRHRPIIPLLIESVAGNRLIVDALVDTGSDITLLPETVADALGIELAGVPEIPVTSALGIVGAYRQAEVTLEFRRAPGDVLKWKAVVGFLPRRMAYSILGTAGFFEFFRLTYEAQQHTLEVDPSGVLPN